MAFFGGMIDRRLINHLNKDTESYMEQVTQQVPVSISLSVDDGLSVVPAHDKTREVSRRPLQENDKVSDTFAGVQLPLSPERTAINVVRGAGDHLVLEIRDTISYAELNLRTYGPDHDTVALPRMDHDHVVELTPNQASAFRQCLSNVAQVLSLRGAELLMSNTKTS